MPRKRTKTSTAACQKGKETIEESTSDMEMGKDDAHPGKLSQQAALNEELANRSLEEILSSISPPPPPAMTNEAGAPRLMITHIVNQNFKSYAGEQILGPFHKRFSCIIGPNGSGKSNVIDSMLFVFGYRAQKIRSKKLSVLIHNSDEHKDIQSCTVEVHFQKIIDKEGDDYEVIPNSNFCVSRTAYRDNSSVYQISGKKSTFKDVGILLRSHGIDLDHNRFLILQGEVEQIAMMKPKGQTEHDEGMLEYLEDLIGSGRLKEPIQVLCRRVETLNEQRGEKLNRVKMVEKEKDALEGERNKAIEFLTLENKMFKEKNHICQYYIYDLQKRINEMETQKQKIHEETKDVNEKSSKLADEMKDKTKALKDIEKKLNKITKFIEENKEKFTQLDLQDVQVREKLKHAKSKAKKLQKQLQKDKEKVEELRNVPANSNTEIREATSKKEVLEKEKEREEEKLKQVMDSLKLETQGLQEEKEVKEKELMEFNKTVNEARSKMDVAQSELDIYLSRHNTAVSQLNKAKEVLMTTSGTLKERISTIKELDTKLPQAEQELKEKECKLEKLGRQELDIKNLVRVQRQKVEAAKSSLAVSRSRGRVLDALLQQKKSGKIPGIYGRLGDLGAIDEKYDIAISSSCGALDYIVVDTIDTAQECVNFLKRQGIGVATFIALDKMSEWTQHMSKIQTPENIPRLFDLVEVKDKKILPAFYFALRNTLVANNLEQATRVAFQKNKRWRVVTLQGQIIEQSGTMTGGGGKVLKGRMGSSVMVEISEEEINKMELQLQNDSKKAVCYQEEKVELEDAIRKLRQSVQEMRSTLEKYTASIQSLSEQEVLLEDQLKELEANVIAAAPDKSKQKDLEKNLNAFKKDYECVAGKAGKVESEVKRLHNLIIEINNHKLKAQQDKLDKINKEIDKYTSAVTKAQVAIKTADRNLKKSEESVLRTEKETGDNEKEIDDLTKTLTTLEEKATEVMNECKRAEESLPEVQEQHRNLLQAMKSIQEDEHVLQKEALSIRLKIEQIDSHVAEHQSKIKYWQKEISKISLHHVEAEPVEELPVLNQEELEAIKDPDIIINQIALLEAQCHEMKPNLGAIAEYNEKEELYLKRVAELDEITNERDNFRQAYEELRKQRLNEFMAGFNIITNKLKENYQMLTLGGDAELELVDSLDPFSEGIVFSVRPPKKSWKKIFNLSGGEKTLSSLALVFALHHYKPTPLYFMDEIDAALDFKNVSIVAFYIYEQTKNAQFIIISLRNNMFEIADRLIGIYKTYNTTKSVATNPKVIASKGLAELGAVGCC
ncbi:structural maintenance of chromosomes protein 4 isoform X1 [Alligator mississippiensis]|uniref:Structural maintenance of chromosomes protein n=1 Tax=Alligator mississippiensis TaxID=8496 RepID=A0A151NB17_ALLMI|nr:structural maintenance of chromosomes protein 4 isoform X1 [Alligator mississippiensis]XP_019347200.1 structural maintenance of chromosomes protein 4 isoform X1 [Alligator mississippiensis]XP_019347201.1 structural maintenance of chromosomes protein 4 isoform X1 [Alligator mississippiensis]XP_019347202.1 structural maintenance of chromosomes protein 4 isoform X1 [Alligator mississippiensis]KYO34038.1 structural maintenance of chromosomes protein 4 isoform B [Alligator mississippiensis]